MNLNIDLVFIFTFDELLKGKCLQNELIYCINIEAKMLFRSSFIVIAQLEAHAVSALFQDIQFFITQRGK